MRLVTRWITIALALMLALPTVGCQQKEKVTENKKGLDVKIEAGNTEVKVEGSKAPDKKGKRLDVEVVRP
jgi:hypothetical protein